MSSSLGSLLSELRTTAIIDILTVIILATTLVLEINFGDLGMIAIVAYGFAVGLGTVGALTVPFRQTSGAFFFAGKVIVKGVVYFFLCVVVASLVILVTLAFGQLCRELFVQFGGFDGVQSTIPNPFHPPFATSPFYYWSVFAYSWLLDSVTFNASQVFGWVTTPIHATAQWSGALIVLFSFVADIVLFASLLKLIGVSLGALFPGLFDRGYERQSETISTTTPDGHTTISRRSRTNR